MFGIEWNQPAVIAEALAQTAIHNKKLGAYLYEVEAAAKDRSTKEQRPLVEIFEALKHDDKLVRSVHYSDHGPGRSSVLDGLVGRAPDEALELLSGISVHPDHIEQKAVEMMHTAAYICSSAAFRPAYEPKFDFILV